MGHRGKKFIHKGVEYDSLEETYFAMWLDELKEQAYIRDWKRAADSFQITTPLINKYAEGKKQKTQTVLQDWSYTPDFVVEWSKYSKGVFYNELGEKIVCPFIADNEISFVEIKPSFDLHNSTRLFKNTQKALNKTCSIYVNLIKIPNLFKETFCPLGFIYTKSGKKRKLKFEMKTINEFF